MHDVRSRCYQGMDVASGPIHTKGAGPRRCEGSHERRLGTSSADGSDIGVLRINSGFASYRGSQDDNSSHSVRGIEIGSTNRE